MMAVSTTVAAPFHIAADTVIGEWGVSGGSYENTGHNPDSQINAENVHLLRRVWTVDPQKDDSIHPIHGETVGPLPTAVGENPVVAEAPDGSGRRVVYFATYNAEVVAVDLADGSEIWRTNVLTAQDLPPMFTQKDWTYDLAQCLTGGPNCDAYQGIELFEPGDPDVPLGSTGINLLTTPAVRRVPFLAFDDETVSRTQQSYSIFGSPVLSQDRVYVADVAANVYALDRATGHLIWTLNVRPIGGEDCLADSTRYRLKDCLEENVSFYGDPVYIDGMVILGVGTFSFQQTERYETVPDGMGGVILEEDGITPLLVPVTNYESRGSIVAVRDRGEHGEIEWEFFLTSKQLDAFGFRMPNDGTFFGAGVGSYSTAAIDTERKILYIGAGQALECPNTITLTPERTLPPLTGTPESCHPQQLLGTALDYSASFIALRYDKSEFADSEIDALGNYQGQLVWKQQLSTPSITQRLPPRVDGPAGYAAPDGSSQIDIPAPPTLFEAEINGVMTDLVAVGSKMGDVNVFNRVTGEEIWETKIDLPADAEGIQSGTAYANGVIYVAHVKRGLNFGIFESPRQLEHPIGFGSVGIDGLGVGLFSIYSLGIADTEMAALNAATGEILWQKQVPQAVWGSLTLGDGVLFVPLGHRVVALDPTTGEELFSDFTFELTSFIANPHAEYEMLFPGSSAHPTDFRGLAMDLNGGITVLDDHLIVPVGATGPAQGGVIAYKLLDKTLWGVDADNGQLFSIGDINDPAATRTDYGALQVEGQDMGAGGIGAFALDSDGTAYLSVNKALAGFDPPVLATIDVDEVASGGSRHLHMIGSVPTPHRLTGLSINPASGQLYGVVDRGATGSLIILGKRDGSRIGHLMPISGPGSPLHTASDLEFDDEGNLYVVDASASAVYRISSASGRILERVDEAPAFNAVAWEPFSKQLVGLADADHLDVRSTYVQSVFDEAALGGILTFANTSTRFTNKPVRILRHVDVVHTTPVEEFGTLTVQISTSTRDIDDRLGIAEGNQMVLEVDPALGRSDILYQGHRIGRWEGGTDGETPLVITFKPLLTYGDLTLNRPTYVNPSANAVKAVLEAITFHHVADTPEQQTREIQFSLSHSIASDWAKTAIGNSNQAVKRVQVQ